MTSFLRRLFRQLGTVRSTASITVLSIVLSLLISLLVRIWFLSQPIAGSSIWIAALIPALIAPPFSYFIIDLLNQLDQSEYERSKLVSELQEALGRIEVLDGLLPICSSCKKIRTDDDNCWQQLEDYIASHLEVNFTHGICPDCARNLYPSLFEKDHSTEQ